MNKFIITEEEKNRILNMHKSKSYLNEQEDNTKNIPILKVGLDVEVINQERRTGYMPVNDPDTVVTFYGKVCNIGELITIKNTKNECIKVLNNSKKFYAAGGKTLGIVDFSLGKEFPACKEGSCGK